ncbi:MAG: hypothetical protein LBR54_04465, partial [Oscillospiraceae bacterium]|nr:hypothetical protein [Oscillospiraceae bacterium]
MNNDFLSDDRTDNTLLLPYSYDAEQTVIGAALIEPASLSLILEHINAEYFYDKKFGDVFLVILSLYASGTPADAVTVLAGCLKANIFPNETAGREFIASLMRSVPSAKNVESYCKIVAEKYYLRSLLYVCRDIQAEIAAGSGVDAEKILEF